MTGGVWLLAPSLYDSGPASIVGHVHGASWHDTSTSLLWQWYDMLPEAVALPLVIAGITLAIATPVVVAGCAIGWAPCCLRREARALLCCVRTVYIARSAPVANPPDVSAVRPFDEISPISQYEK